jgi:hypothetical protein
VRLDATAAELNKRPRQTRGWMKPHEALDLASRRPRETKGDLPSRLPQRGVPNARP